MMLIPRRHDLAVTTAVSPELEPLRCKRQLDVAEGPEIALDKQFRRPSRAAL